MLHAGEGAAHLTDSFYGHLAPHGSGSSQQVLDVVQAAQLDILLGKEGGHDAILGHAEHAILAQEGTVVGIVQAGEPHLLTLAVCLHGAADLVFIAQHGAAGLLLVQQDIALGIDVFLHILVVIQMVRGHVGDHGDVGAGVHADQLEAGKLHHSHILRGYLRQHGQQRCADVATQMHLAACSLVELGDKGGGGGFAVRAGHCHDLARAEVEEQFHLAGDHSTGSHGILQGLFKVAHKARRAHDDVLPLEAVQIVFAKAQVDAKLPDGGGVIAKVLHALFLVAQSHMSAQLHKLLNKGLVADARADKGDLFALNKLGKLLLIFLHKNSSSSIGSWYNTAPHGQRGDHFAVPL